MIAKADDAVRQRTGVDTSGRGRAKSEAVFLQSAEGIKKAVLHKALLLQKF
jgi:hypothetical protein